MPDVVLRLIRVGQGRSLYNPLLAHDAACAAAIVKDLLSRWKDLAALTTLLVAGILFARQSLSGLEQRLAAALLPGLGSGVALLTDIALRRRLHYFSRESALAPAALLDRTRLGYRLGLHLFLGIALALLLYLPDLALCAQFIASWLIALIPIEVVFATFRAVPAHRFQPLVAGLRRVLDSRASGKGLITVASSAGILLLAIALLAPTASAPFFAAIIAVLVLGWYSPVDHAVVNFERIVGLPPIASVRKNLRYAARSGALLVAVAIVSTKSAVGLSVGAAMLAVMAYRALSILLSRIFKPREVEFALMAVLFVTLFAAISEPFVAPLLLCALVPWLLRRASSKTWILV